MTGRGLCLDGPGYAAVFAALDDEPAASSRPQICEEMRRQLLRRPGALAWGLGDGEAMDGKAMDGEAMVG